MRSSVEFHFDLDRVFRRTSHRTRVFLGLFSVRRKKEIDLRDRFHMSAVINNGDRHAEIGMYNAISHLRAAPRLICSERCFTLPPVSTIPKMNYLQKFSTCIKPGSLLLARIAPPR